MAKTQQVTLTTTVHAAGEWIEHRFIGFDGGQATANAAVLGVAAYDAKAGDYAAVHVGGIAVVEAAGALAVGTALAADAQGMATAYSTGAQVGTALDAATAQGDLIRVLLKG